MIRRLFLIALVVLTTGGLGLVGVQAMRGPRTVVVQAPAATPAQPASLPEQSILTAIRPLQAGTLLRDDDFAPRSTPAAAVPAGALLDTPDARAGLRGALLRRYLDPGAALAADDVLRPRDRGFLAAVLAQNMRAISVGVDAVTGASGLIWPGDRVDLILTQELDPASTAPGHRVVGETILRNARVIAVDQQIAQGAVTDGTAGRIARTVTLEVAPDEAERVTVASRLGQIALAVRPIEAAAAKGEASNPLFGGDVSLALAHTGKPATSRMNVIQGTDRQEVTFP